MKGLKALLTLVLLGLPAWCQAPVRMAVLAFRPKSMVAEDWRPLGHYLETSLGRRVEITPYDFTELNAAITRNEVDAVLTNPGHYILLKQHNVMSAPLVTRVGYEGGQRLSAFGGVIFTRSEAAGIKTLEDLAGRRIAAVGRESLGGYQMQAFELLEAGVNPPRADRLIATGMPHDRVVEAVLSGQAEAGFVRTGLLEALASEGKLDLNRIRIINPQSLATFPFVVSTRLHPEWLVAVFPQVDPHLADHLAIALLSLPPDGEAARSAGIAGFTVPADYTGVEQMLRRLRVPPFEMAPQVTLGDLWERYAWGIVGLVLVALVLVAMSAGLVIQNRQIQQNEFRSSTILNNLDAFIYLKDLKGRYLFANQRVLELWKISLEGVLHKDDSAFFDADTTARIREVDRNVLVHGETIRTEETNTVKETGRTSTYWSIKMPLRRPDGSTYALCGISTDITDRKRAEEASAYLAAIVESSEDAIVSKSLDGTVTSWNNSAERIFGYTAEEMVGQSVLTLIPPGRMDEEPQILGSILSGESIEHFETIRLRKDGSPIAVSITISPLRNAEGTIIGASKVIRDITRQKEAESALKEALVFSEQIIHSAQEGIAVYDLEGRFVRINRHLERLSGWSSAEVVGRSPSEVMSFAKDSGIELGIQQALKGARTTNLPYQWHYARTGRSGWATSVQGPLWGAGGEIIGVISVGTDITEIRKAEDLQRKLEADLQQTQKLESLGSLAGGIAHDMNNVLAAIQAIAQTLKYTHASEAGLVASLDTIERASTRGRDLVKGLTNFARKDLREPEQLDLNALVQDEVDILRRTTLQKVNLVVDLDASRPFVLGERSTLASAIMNLCVNALDAMPEGGSLTLGTRRLPDAQVAFSVTDTGQGMSPDVLARAMEPFFTTKDVGKGTGLGLAMVYTTAKAHGGSVRITSEPGKGTCVTLHIPTVTRTDAQGDSPQSPVEGSTCLKILQVDDDELILQSVPTMIEALGHSIRTAMGGQEALALLANGLDVELVILDLNMPGMNGEETLREIRKTHAHLPVLLATGFLDARTEAILKGDDRVRSISKPFSMAELGAKIKEMATLRA